MMIRPYFFVLILNVLITAAAAAECKEPFSSNTSFVLQESLNCDPNVAHSYKLTLTQDTSPPAQGAPYLSPSCYDGLKGVNLYWGTIEQNGMTYDYIVDFSTNVDAGDEQKFKITRFCDQDVIAILNTRQQTITVHGTDLSVAYEVQTANGELGYDVLSKDDEAASVSVRAATGEVVASARKTLVNENGCGRGIWTATLSGTLDPTILAYIIAAKDNKNYSCTTQVPTTTAPPDTRGRDALVISGVALGGVAILSGVSIYLVRRYKVHLSRMKGFYETL